MTAAPATFTVLPSTPTPEHLAACRADALALLDVPLDPTSPADPAYGVDSGDVRDFLVRPGDVVRVLNVNYSCKLYARVVKVLANDMVLVRDLVYGAVQWRVPVDAVALALTREAADVGMG